MLVHLVASDTMIIAYNLGLYRSSNTPIHIQGPEKDSKYFKTNKGNVIVNPSQLGPERGEVCKGPVSSLY